jgi:hypothetical protein
LISSVRLVQLIARTGLARGWGGAYLRGRAKMMKANLRYWRSVLREAERELEAATGKTTMNAAAKKLMRAKAELKRLQAEVSA